VSANVFFEDALGSERDGIHQGLGGASRPEDHRNGLAGNFIGDISDRLPYKATAAGANQCPEGVGFGNTNGEVQLTGEEVGHTRRRTGYLDRTFPRNILFMVHDRGARDGLTHGRRGEPNPSPEGRKEKRGSRTEHESPPPTLAGPKGQGIRTASLHRGSQSRVQLGPIEIPASHAHRRGTYDGFLELGLEAPTLATTATGLQVQIHFLHAAWVELTVHVEEKKASCLFALHDAPPSPVFSLASALSASAEREMRKRLRARQR
jgi:hypothetical protein